MKPSEYRTANLIIQTILEGIIRSERDDSLLKQGIVKSHLIRYCGLKSTTAEKYLLKLEKADYIKKREEMWGERIIIIYTVTPLGKERHEWFVKINSEME
ncbi:MAG: hypothetical protein ACTSSK_06815 [Candidatus Heimdallarchaeota archaeon]